MLVVVVSEVGSNSNYLSYYYYGSDQTSLLKKAKKKLSLCMHVILFFPFGDRVFWQYLFLELGTDPEILISFECNVCFVVTLLLGVVIFIM